MPQYDPYEEQIMTRSALTPLTEVKPSLSNGSRAESSSSSHPEQAPHTQQSHASSTGAGSFSPENTNGDVQPGPYHTQHPNDHFYSPIELHERHSHLERQQRPEERTVESVFSPETDRAMSPKTLNSNERRQLAEAERSQQEDDQIRMMLASNRREEEPELERNHAKPTTKKQTAKHIDDRGRTFTTHGGQVAGC